MDQDFSFCNTIFPDEFPSAGDLFLNGKILPIGVEKTFPSSCHVQQFIAVPPQRTSLDASHFSDDFTPGRLKELKNPSKEVDGHQSCINQESSSPYKRYSASGKIHHVERKRRIASPRLRLPLAAFFQFDDFNEPSPRQLKPLHSLLEDEDFNKASGRLKPLSALLQEDEDSRNALKTFSSLKRSTVCNLASGDGGNSLPFGTNVQQVVISDDGPCHEHDWQELEGLQFSTPPAYKKLPLTKRNPGFIGNLCSCLLFSL